MGDRLDVDWLGWALLLMGMRRLCDDGCPFAPGAFPHHRLHLRLHARSIALGVNTRRFEKLGWLQVRPAGAGRSSAASLPHSKKPRSRDHWLALQGKYLPEITNF